MDTYYTNERKEMLHYLPKHATKILEVGCGEGGFGALVKAQNPNITYVGVEPVAEAAKIAAQKIDACFEGNFDGVISALTNQYDTFDCVIFNDVLEHLVDPWAALELCKRLLKPSGHVVASIPNILYFHDFLNILLKQDWQYQESGILDKTHLRFFTKKSMISMFNKTGFEIEKMQGIHPTDSKKMTLFNLVTLGKFKDMKYLQFALRAKLV